MHASARARALAPACSRAGIQASARVYRCTRIRACMNAVIRAMPLMCTLMPQARSGAQDVSSLSRRRTSSSGSSLAKSSRLRATGRTPGFFPRNSCSCTVLQTSALFSFLRPCSEWQLLPFYRSSHSPLPPFDPYSIIIYRSSPSQVLIQDMFG